ncbi:GGDEF domain-containing protein [Desulfosporosinus shakirovi]|uniref:GGDEF domain-containing protein n=1 Tax=Desulfosporosinus shakirovi TaxID=2885154 RepID=UPI001E56A74B|nr:GGDEF domain-containing protein [Desulfosporosinus sp. SRJS8]MCB8816175.1 GGDEF domain-containing protein [Desulfosporosinus sp. SRJS8]
MKTTVKSFFSTLPIFILILMAYFLYRSTSTMSNQQLDIIKFAPYVIFFVGSAIAWRFNRSCVFFILIILTLCLASIYYSQETIGNSTQSTDINMLVSLVIPINFALFPLFKERGIVSLWGLIRIGFITSQLLFSFYFFYSGQSSIFITINENILPINLQSITSISQISIIAFLVTLIILFIRLILYKSYQDISFIAVLFVLFFVLHINSQLLYSIFFTTSGIILIISIIQDTYSMAFFDELTGLPSRRALKQDIMKLGHKYSIAMLDIDHFKKFNDTYGHDTGDEVLKLVASVIKDVMGGGKPFRYGGEEFTILFPGKSINDVLPHLEELREKISKKGFILRDKNRSKKKPKSRPRSSKPSKQIFITVSIGVSSKNEKCKTPDNVLKSADVALYRAKKKGRNCVISI